MFGSEEGGGELALYEPWLLVLRTSVLLSICHDGVKMGFGIVAAFPGRLDGCWVIAQGCSSIEGFNDAGNPRTVNPGAYCITPQRQS